MSVMVDRIYEDPGKGKRIELDMSLLDWHVIATGLREYARNSDYKMTRHLTCLLEQVERGIAAKKVSRKIFLIAKAKKARDRMRMTMEKFFATKENS